MAMMPDGPHQHQGDQLPGQAQPVQEGGQEGGQKLQRPGSPEHIHRRHQPHQGRDHPQEGVQPGPKNYDIVIILIFSTNFLL